MTTPTSPTPTGSAEVDAALGLRHLEIIDPHMKRAIARHEWRNPTRPTRLADSELVRFVIFNTGECNESNVMDELRGVLDQGTFSAIVRCKRIVRTGSQPRCDIWVRESVAVGIARSIRDATRDRTPQLLRALRAHLDKGSRADLRLRSTRPVGKWRVARFVQWRDRDPQSPISSKSAVPKLEASQCSIVSWNINGFHSRKHNVVELLESRNVVALALQETLVARWNHPVRIKGYVTYEMPKEEGFRGQAVLIDSRLHSYRIPHEGLDVLHVKVAGFRENGMAFHLLGCYFPSGAQRRAERSAAWTHLQSIVASILEKDDNANVVCCGDFNDSPETVQSRIEIGGLRYLVPASDPLTRFPRRGNPSSLDHFVCSAGAVRSCVHRPKVLKSYKVSDHVPVMARLRKVRVPRAEPTSSSKCSWHTPSIRTKSSPLVHHNRWSSLPVEDIVDAVTLDKAADDFAKASDSVERELGIRKNGGGYEREMLPKKLKRKLKRYRVAEAAKSASPLGEVPEAVETEWRNARKDFKFSLKFWKRSRGAKKYSRLAEDLLNGDLKEAWSAVNSCVDRKGTANAVPPIRKGDGSVVTKADEVADVFMEHYRALAQDDPKGLRDDAEYWRRVLPGDLQPERVSLNRPLVWKDVVAAIRRMNRNTAPGGDSVHVNVLKALVMEESMAVVKLRAGEHWRRPDNVRIDVPLDDFLTTPLTPMGRQLWRIIRAVWDLEWIPSSWRQCTVISLYKSGDPEDTTNYRGITLISVMEKVLLQIMQERLGEEFALGDLISQEQSGFRSGEECMGQFIAMHESIRRRYRAAMPTFGVFVDFKKAFDKVHHGALFRACERKGIQGKFLGLIKHIYANTKLRVRIGERYAEPFDMQRGVRQGCSISPPLFSVYIDSAWEDLAREGSVQQQQGAGVAVPGLRGPTRVASGRYADDIVGLATSSSGLQIMLDELSDWGNDTEMALGIQKCGTMLWGEPSPANRDLYEAAQFTTPWGDVPKVNTYKYLGIEVTSEWHKSGDTDLSGNDDAARHVERMRGKGQRIAAVLHPLLRDPKCPIAIKVHTIRNVLVSSVTYGAEWYGYKRKNTLSLDSLVGSTTRWVVGAKRNDNSYASNVLMIELGIPSVEEHAAAMRMRLAAKLQLGNRTNTLVGVLWNNQPTGTAGLDKRVETWMTGCQKWYDRYVVPALSKYRGGDDETVPSPDGRAWPLRESLSRARMYERHIRSNSYRSAYLEHINEVRTGVTREGIVVDLDLLGVDQQLLEAGWIATPATLQGPRYEDEREDQFALVLSQKAQARGAVAQEEYLVMNVRDCILDARVDPKLSVAADFYDRWSLAATRGWTRQTLQRTDLSDGFRWLLSVRTGGFPSVRKASIRARFTKKVVTWLDGRCPLCQSPVHDRYEWMHLMVECDHQLVLNARNRHLSDLIAKLNYMWDSRPRNFPEGVEEFARSKMGMQSTWGPNRFYTAIALIGGSIPSLWDHDFHYGFGHLDWTPREVTAPLVVFTAGFLQKVSHVYCSALGIKIGPPRS